MRRTTRFVVFAVCCLAALPLAAEAVPEDDAHYLYRQMGDGSPTTLLNDNGAGIYWVHQWGLEQDPPVTPYEYTKLPGDRWYRIPRYMLEQKPGAYERAYSAYLIEADGNVAKIAELEARMAKLAEENEALRARPEPEPVPVQAEAAPKVVEKQVPVADPALVARVRELETKNALLATEKASLQKQLARVTEQRDLLALDWVGMTARFALIAILLTIVILLLAKWTIRARQHVAEKRKEAPSYESVRAYLLAEAEKNMDEFVQFFESLFDSLRFSAMAANGERIMLYPTQIVAKGVRVHDVPSDGRLQLRDKRCERQHIPARHYNVEKHLKSTEHPELNSSVTTDPGAQRLDRTA